MKDSWMSANKTAGTAAIMDPTVGIKFNRTAITPHRTAYSTPTIVNKINIVTRTKRNNFDNVNFYKISQIRQATKDITHVINVLPLHEETKGLFNYKLFRNLDNVYYICAGRAETHINKDVLEALDNKFLRGASLDVYGLPNGEIQQDFLDNKQIHLSPHISGWTSNFWPNQSEIILYNINMFRKNNYNKMKNLVYCKGSKLNE